MCLEVEGKYFYELGVEETPVNVFKRKSEEPYAYFQTGCKIDTTLRLLKMVFMCYILG